MCIIKAWFLQPVTTTKKTFVLCAALPPTGLHVLLSAGLRFQTNEVISRQIIQHGSYYTFAMVNITCLPHDSEHTIIPSHRLTPLYWDKNTALRSTQKWSTFAVASLVTMGVVMRHPSALV